MVYNFENTKKDILGKRDKSNVGFMDDRIKGLCDAVNSGGNMFTTSSCSGRVVLIKDSEKKEGGLFLFRSHDLVSFDELKLEVEKVASEISEGLVIFKQESCLLVVSCKDNRVQDWLFNLARNNGWKKSGILSLNRKYLVELMSSGSLEFPVVKDGKVLVDDDFLRIVVDRANRNLEKGWERIGWLKDNIYKGL
jgi:tRNA wybutosine-synthesizing protein 3